MRDVSSEALDDFNESFSNFSSIETDFAVLGKEAKSVGECGVAEELSWTRRSLPVFGIGIVLQHLPKVGGRST